MRRADYISSGTFATIVRAELAKGATWKAIGELIGTHANSARIRAARMGIRTTAGPGARPNPERQAERARRYQAGESMSAIARDHGVTARAVSVSIERLRAKEAAAR